MLHTPPRIFCCYFILLLYLYIVFIRRRFHVSASVAIDSFCFSLFVSVPFFFFLVEANSSTSSLLAKANDTAEERATYKTHVKAWSRRAGVRQYYDSRGQPYDAYASTLVSVRADALHTGVRTAVPEPVFTVSSVKGAINSFVNRQMPNLNAKIRPANWEIPPLPSRNFPTASEQLRSRSRELSVITGIPCRNGYSSPNYSLFLSKNCTIPNCKL